MNNKNKVNANIHKQKERREKYRDLHVRAAARSKFSAELCEDIAKRYPLQSAHDAGRLFRVLEARSLLAGSRAVSFCVLSKIFCV